MAQLRIQGVRPLFLQAIAATLAVIVIPVGAAIALAATGLPQPEFLTAAGIAVAMSCGIAAIGSALWIRQPRSVDVTFGELMLWRWARRRRAEATLDRGSEALRLADLKPDHLSPEGKLVVLHQLTTALEMKDPYTHGHSKRVERHAYNTALAMGLAPEQIEELRLAASLHDVGKIHVPDAVLRKPGALTIEEIAMVREHVDLGAVMLVGAASDGVIEAVRHHHERWDGAGYPSGLSGAEIPFFARIIAVVDAYDAITSARPYKAGSARRDAVAALEEGAGVQFDPEIVTAFLSTLPSAVPALGALLMFAWPAQMMRRASVWAKSMGAGSIAGAAGTASVAVIVGTAGVTGNIPGWTPSEPSLPIEVESGSISGERSALGVFGSQSERSSGQGDEDARRQPHRSDAVKAEGSAHRPSGGSDGDTQKDDAPVARPENSEPDVEEDASDPPENDDDTDGSAPSSGDEGGGHQPPGDPQPDKGKDCDPKQGNGQGHNRHCGDD